MGPGPGNPYPEVALGFARPLLGHLDPAFLAVLDETNDRLRTVWKTSNRLTFPVSGTGSAGMEISFVNVVQPGSVAVIGVNGVFGGRMCDVAARAGAEVVRVDFEWGQPVDPDRLLAAHPSPDVIALVHAETSTGVQSDVAAVAERKGDALLIADCVTSLGGIPVAIDEWGVDIAYSGTQKCLGVPPGLAPFTINERALERLVPTPQSWYLDLNLIAGYVGTGAGRSYHHTAPISMIQALHAGLGALLEEGLEASWERHQRVGDLLKSGLLERGFELFAAEGHRLPELTTAVVPGSIDEADVRRRLLEEYDIEIGGGLGPVAGKVWRIGTMGHTARESNVEMFLAALDALM
ncbi:MAG TPA: alanine--glyoxylate aminotransferase family protein [Acidimicrobiia bacterium]|jgi:alanine-glyoxylate transaminase/serine-glyoxylate transaminase/serine-pyruvate transaminase